MVAELCKEELILRVGERSGLLGPEPREVDADDVSTFKGDDSVLTITGKSLLSVLGETVSDGVFDESG